MAGEPEPVTTMRLATPNARPTPSQIRVPRYPSAMAVLWARRIGNIRTPMPITNAELSSISAAPVTNNAVEPLRSAERTMPVAMRLHTPYAKKPARKGTPTIRAVRRTLEYGRTTGGDVEWLEAGIGSTFGFERSTRRLGERMRMVPALEGLSRASVEL